MGRGSYATIQKHLDAIRQERAPVVPIAPGTMPAPPADAVAAIWGAAYAAAQALTLGRLETVTAALSAKQQLETTLESHKAEIVRLTGELERVTREAESSAALAQREAKIKLQALQTVLDKAIHEASDYKSLLARLTPSKG